MREGRREGGSERADLQVSVDYFLLVTVADTVKYLLHTFAAESEKCNSEM